MLVVGFSILQWMPQYLNILCYWHLKIILIISYSIEFFPVVFQKSHIYVCEIEKFNFRKKIIWRYFNFQWLMWQVKTILKKANFKNILKLKLYFLSVYNSNCVTLKWKVCVCIGLWVTHIYTAHPKRTENTQKCYKTKFIL